MGLDWNPGPKPQPGYEGEFLELWHELQVPGCGDRQQKVERFGEITITAFETLETPRVGYDDRAAAWARRAYERRVEKSLPLDQFLAKMRGFYVLDLVPSCDGVPRYSNAIQEVTLRLTPFEHNSSRIVSK